MVKEPKAEVQKEQSHDIQIQTSLPTKIFQASDNPTSH